MINDRDMLTECNTFKCCHMYQLANDLLWFNTHYSVKVVIHVEMPKAAPKSPFVIFKN